MDLGNERSTTKLGQDDDAASEITLVDEAAETLDNTVVASSSARVNAFSLLSTNVGDSNDEQATTEACLKGNEASVPLEKDAASKTKTRRGGSRAVPASRLTVILATDKCLPGREADDEDPDISQMSDEVNHVPLVWAGGDFALTY